MDIYFRTKQVEFNNEANELFHDALQKFRHDIKGINRERDENVFQLLRSKYSYDFRQQLERRAAVVIERCHLKHLQRRLGISLTEIIVYFETEFMRNTDEW